MFAQLNTKTVYSFMESLVDLDTYIKRANKLGYRTLGIMDDDHLYGAYDFIKRCQKAGIRPVVGLEFDLFLSEQAIRFQAIAKNTAGYQALLKLSTLKMTGQAQFEVFAPYLTEDLAIILPDDLGLSELNLPFDYFVEVGLEKDQLVTDRPALPLHEVRYFEESDLETLQVLHAIRDNVTLKDVPVPKRHQALIAADRLTELFKEKHPQALANLEDLVAEIHYDFDTSLKLPHFNRSKEAVVELRERAFAGLEAKGLLLSHYVDRLEQELAVIHQMGFDDYFLIVWDLVRFGREQGYYMGMGRGSAAGSLVAYALDITGIDPVKNHLLFERFLNVERYSMPDIDIDLPDIYRSHFLHYVRNRYGSTHSAQIVTFSTFGAKQAIRDVFKRFGAREHELTEMTKKIGFKDSLQSAYTNNLSFRQLIKSRPEFERAFAIAQKLEGKPRQTSIHAAGVVLSDDQLTNHIPLKSGEDMMITQYDAPSVEANGLLKMDFLGLRNLTFVQKMKERLLELEGIDLDIKAIDLEDKQTLALFANGHTKGIFQFEQAGAINLLKRIKPARFEEIVATTSLNRPGASDYTENFIRRKFGQEAVDLIDPAIAPILEPTYGIMLYQEQVMQIAQVYGSFSLGRADLLRRAMSKKDAKEMAKMSQEFMVGAKALNHPEQTAHRLFEMMAKFAGYGFNKSHAYAYSALAFQLAYFKAHYPAIFYDVMLNYSSGDYIRDALRTGFVLGKLSINTIPYTDKVKDREIILGLKNIRQVPRDLAYWMIENRPFSGVEDFLTRLPQKYHKEEVLLPLIQLGLFDEFEANRRQIELNLSSLLVFVTELGSLFAESSYNWVIHEDYSPAEKYTLEQELIGVGISPHPLLAILEEHKGKYQPLTDLIAEERATVLAQIQAVRVIRTKTKGQQMAFVTVTDTDKTLDVTVFPETYQQVKEQLIEGKMAWLIGRVKERDGRLQLILEQMKPLVTEKLWLLMADHGYDQEISEILQAHPGDIPVVIHYEETKETLQIKAYQVEKTPALLEALNLYVMKTVFR